MSTQLCGKPTKNGGVCGYRVTDTNPCPHHSGDGSKARAFQRKGALASQEARTVQDVAVDLTTEDGISRTLQNLGHAAATQANANLKRIAEIRKCCDSAVSLRQTTAVRELNKTLLRLEHGEKAVLILEQLRANRALTPLPGLPGQSKPKKETVPHADTREN